MTNRGRIRFSPTVAGRRRASCRSSGVWSGGAGPALLQFHDDTIRIAVREWLHAPNVAAAMYGHISNWDTSNVRDMSMLFYEAFGFNEPLGNWDTRNVVNMSGMFDGAVSFNQPLGNWDTGNVVNMGLMFSGAHSFNQPLSDLDTSNVENMGSMFSGASAFNQPLGNWDTRNVRSMTGMFRQATALNQPLNQWDTRNVRSMTGMFRQATAFNQPLNQWDTRNVRSMDTMFRGASAFNQPLNNWDTRNVEGMYEMFYGATAFNQPLDQWDTGGVVTMDYMFRYATSFNHPIDNWDIAGVRRWDVHDDTRARFDPGADANLLRDRERHRVIDRDVDSGAWRIHWNMINQQGAVQGASNCSLCLENPSSVVFTGCHHWCVCEDCYERMPSRRCPLCRTVSVAMHHREYLDAFPVRPNNAPYLAGGSRRRPKSPTRRHERNVRSIHTLN